MFTLVCGKAVNLAGLDDKNEKRRCALRFKYTQQLSGVQPPLLDLFSSNKLNVRFPNLTSLPFDEGPSLNSPPSFKKREELAAKQNPGHKNANMLSDEMHVSPVSNPGCN